MSNLLLKSSFNLRNRNVGIGPVSLFALIIIVCMATLAMLTVSTAHSSLVLSQRQAEATQELYLSETAAQTFLADLDEMLQTQASGQAAGTEAGQAAGASTDQAAGPDTNQASGTGTGQAAGTNTASAAQSAAVISDAQLIALRDSAQDATDGKVAVIARADGNNVYAEFACAGGRTLKITLAIQPDGTYQIERWKMTAVVNEEQEMGTLYLGD